MDIKNLRDSEYMQRWFDQAGYDAANEIELLLKTFAHYHVNNGHNKDDSCKQCGLDLRHEIHYANKFKDIEQIKQAIKRAEQ